VEGGAVSPISLRGISPCAYEFWLPLLHTEALRSFLLLLAGK